LLNTRGVSKGAERSAGSRTVGLGVKEVNMQS
jgi:hypothetical protein